MHISLLTLTSLFPLGLAVPPLVSLPYARYRGLALDDGTTQWLGMRYAAPPLGALRFARPAPPPKTHGVQDAKVFGNICLSQSPDDWTNEPSDRIEPGEDCLFVNVFAPSGAPRARKGKRGLPVMLFIQGGGFVSNSNANYHGRELAARGIVVVSFNYRVGPFGFLGGDEEGEGRDANAGLWDQIAVMEWVRDHVGEFGGNPKHVVLNGVSAGAASIIYHLTSPLLYDTPLFIGAILESTVPAVPLRTLEQGRPGYDCLVAATGCTNTPSPLTCLRAANASALQTRTCTFNPNLDGSLIVLPSLQSFDRGHYTKIPTILGSTTNEGTIFVPPSIATLDQAHTFFSLLIPNLPPSALAILDRLFLSRPAPTFPNAGPYWRPTANAISAIGSHCLDLHYQDAMVRDGVPTWNYHYAVRDPGDEASGLGVYHAVELHAVWGVRNADGSPPESYWGVNKGVVDVVQGLWVGFVKGLEPGGRWRGFGGGGRLRIEGNGTGMEGLGGLRVVCREVEGIVRAVEFGG
ncbi:alpha/beta-hydrolase [Corynespora cassiicola Philippines]|uniref:Carboxylic ester hydrolase n=1 Tax=Corynespora cassiicola Philippines TaxID=1448308 RepID=A0A2T2P0V8_CORCC|nr:alpha/beta-hydrolase [Corynespora cassiicola Philippines]